MTDRIKPTRIVGAYSHEDYTETHPAYGMIGASRVTSSPPGVAMFGSDFQHQRFVKVTIMRGELSRSLSEDRHRGVGVPLVEVALSEAQWATFVSAMNIGHGVPCTLEIADGERLPGIEPTTDRREQINAEVIDTMRDALTTLEELREAAPTNKLKKKVDMAIQQIKSNIPFVAKQFDEHVENTVEKAKIEVNAYVTQAIQRAGITALTGGQPPFELSSSRDEPFDIVGYLADDEEPPRAE